MQSQSYLFGPSWESLPSPKIRSSDRSGAYGWTHLYTGFSEDFAREALTLLVSRSSDIVLDPFAGAGTTLRAAQYFGHPAIGVEIDAFTALLARAALATRVERRRVMSYLRTRTRRYAWCGNRSAFEIFAEDDLRYCAAVTHAIGRATAHASWHEILAGAQFDSEAIALAAIVLSASDSARVTRGSNPVWIRKLKHGEKKDPINLPEIAMRNAARIMRDVDDRYAQRSQLAQALIMNRDFREVSPREAAFDVVLTSPPYLNRVDYVVNHFAELELLSCIVPVDFDGLRRQMVGTTKMIHRHEPAPEWGDTCLHVLETIRKHPSKASPTYYHQFYLQYFNDTSAMVTLLRQAARPRARGAVIVQDSYYKELRVPLARIWIEMCAAKGIEARIVRSEPVRSHIGRLSPRQKAHSPRKVLEESVVALRF